MKTISTSLPLTLLVSSSRNALSFAPVASLTSSRSTTLLPSSLSPADAATTSLDASQPATATTTKFWKWRNHDIFTEVRTPIEKNNDKPTVILLHGFGASTTYWRETMSFLQKEGYQVHALDLLGQGRSSKPVWVEEDGIENENATKEESVMEMGMNTNTQVDYSTNLWATMVDDYARHHQLGGSDQGVVLMGNSLGSLVALAAATGDFAPSENVYLAGSSENGHSSRVRGICLFNCAVGLNSRNVLKNPDYNVIQLAILNWTFDVFNNLIFDNKPLLRYALNNVVTQELLRDALRGLYPHDPQRVDDELVDSFYYPAKLGGEGGVEAIRQIYTNDAGLTPMEMHEKYPEELNSFPLHLIWGDTDVVTPLNGDVGSFYCDRVANNRGGKGLTTIDVVKGGHIPFDDNPVECHDAMMKWLEKKVGKG